jgi:hypothetical protein
MNTRISKSQFEQPLGNTAMIAFSDRHGVSGFIHWQRMDRDWVKKTAGSRSNHGFR